MKQKYGLIGKSLSHSFSPGYFSKKFSEEGIDASYECFEFDDLADFPAWLRNNAPLSGLNVTIPYKEAIMPFLDEIDAAAEAIGAVNCIVFNGERTKGYNTDWIGFMRSLNNFLVKPIEKSVKALVLGNGGASKAVQYALAKMDISATVAGRSGVFDIDFATLTVLPLTDFQLIIHTTPIGMYPHVGEVLPLRWDTLQQSHFLFDLIYNPAQSAFLQKGEAAGAAIANGLEMLHFQAEAAWVLWQEHLRK